MLKLRLRILDIMQKKPSIITKKSYKSKKKYIIIKKLNLNFIFIDVTFKLSRGPQFPAEEEESGDSEH